MGVSGTWEWVMMGFGGRGEWKEPKKGCVVDMNKVSNVRQL